MQTLSVGMSESIQYCKEYELDWGTIRFYLHLLRTVHEIKGICVLLGDKLTLPADVSRNVALSKRKATECNRLEWNGMERNGWKGMEWNRREWNGTEWKGIERNESERNGMEQNGM
jgi:hypothetical protein